MKKTKVDELQKKVLIQERAIKHLIRAIKPKTPEQYKHRDFALALMLGDAELNADIDEFSKRHLRQFCEERYLKNA